jgi:hypothetical protein
MIACCGLDCSKCDGYLATQSADEAALARVAERWSSLYHAEVKPEHVTCDGCRSRGRKSFHCANTCEIRKCADAKGFGTCVECGDFACRLIEPLFGFAPEARENLEKLKACQASD